MTSEAARLAQGKPAVTDLEGISAQVHAGHPGPVPGEGDDGRPTAVHPGQYRIAVERHVQHPGTGLEPVNLRAGPQRGIECIPSGPGKPVPPFEACLAIAEWAQVAALAGRRGALSERVVMNLAGSAAQVCPGAVTPLELRRLNAGPPGQRTVPQPPDERGHRHVPVDVDCQGDEAVLVAELL